MTTEQTNLQNSEGEESSAERPPVSEMMPNPASPEVIEPPTQSPSPRQEDQGVTEQSDEQAQGQGVQHDTYEVKEESTTFSFTEAIPLVEEDVARPFTDFIEEFRQAEEARVVSNSGTRWSAFRSFEENSSPRESIVESFSVEEPGQNEFNTAWGNTSVVSEPSIVDADKLQSAEEQKEQASGSQEIVEESAPGDSAASLPVETPGEISGEESEAKPSEAETTAPARPVSPLLRPPSRLRLPRHGSAASRQREEPPVVEAAPVTPETDSTQEQSRPARRYRFDRPAASNASTASTSTQPRTEEGKETTSHSSKPSNKESKDGKEHDGLKRASQASEKTANGTQSQTPEQSAAKQAAASETPAGPVEGNVTSIATGYDSRRQGQTRQRGQEQTSATPVVPETEVAAPSEESTATPQTTEVALEDLPPLEYADLQRASSRRRRRRRPGEITPAQHTAGPATTPTIPPAQHTAGPASTALTTKPVLPEQQIVPAQTPTQTPAVTTPRNIASTPSGPIAGNQYNIVSGYTVSQMNQGNEDSGPFMSPEPSPARGSTPVRGNIASHGRSVRAEVQRPLVYPVRTGDPALNQLANAVVQGIQAQTDRMVNEIRRANQVPANISVSLPSFPSTERVGVFVDVANLLYSARTLRITIDFAKLLDFLRGNRRLVRAQAYCPTSPHSSEDQMFLQAVKGLGYRITTKNYKTFSSGAKKADLDLDLCMDVVRLVDGRAVDCIVLVSGDSDFMPMLDYCSDHGVRVEVAAFDEAMSATLRQSCDLFINLAMLEEIRA